MPAAKKRTRRAVTPPRPTGITINANTIVGAFGAIVTTVIGAVVIYLVTGALKTGVDNKNTLMRIDLDVPHIKDSISDVNKKVENVAADVKDAKVNMVTRQELDNKHNRLQDSIKEVKADVKDVATRQQKLQDEFRQQPEK